MKNADNMFKTADQIRREKGLTGRRGDDRGDRAEERQNWREYQRALAEANRKPGDALTKPKKAPRNKFVKNPTPIETPAFREAKKP